MQIQAQSAAQPRRQSPACGATLLLCLTVLFAFPCGAQQQSAPAPSGQPDGVLKSAEKATGDEDPKSPNKSVNKDDRIFGVMPNFLTVESFDQVAPLTWKAKYKMTAEGAFDPYEFAVVGVVAGIHQAQDQDAPFGQGALGYGKRYGSGFADQAIGNIMTGAVFPSLLRTDPRYFQMGRGGFGHRFFYAVERIFVTRRDSGGSIFNFSEFLGNAAAAGISNAYYPAQDRTISNNLNTWTTQISIDAFGNELKEFWPDIHHWLKKKVQR